MNLSRLDVETAIEMLSPEMPTASRKSTARINSNCHMVGKPTKMKHVSRSGDIYIIPLSPPERTRPMASSKRVIGKLSI